MLMITIGLGFALVSGLGLTFYIEWKQGKHRKWAEKENQRLYDEWEREMEYAKAHGLPPPFPPNRIYIP